MELTSTYFDSFKEVGIDDSDKWNSYVIVFMTDLTSNGTEEQKRDYRLVFDWISNSDWEELEEGLVNPFDILGEDSLKIFVRQGKHIYDLLVQSNETIKTFKSQETVDPTVSSFLSMYNLPGIITEGGQKFVAKYFVDGLGLSDADRSKIVPFDLFKLGDAVKPDEFVDKVTRLLEAIENGDVENAVKHLNVASDKEIRFLRQVRKAPIVNLEDEDPTDVPPVSPPRSTALLTLDTDFGINTGGAFDEEQITFNDTGLKSLMLAVIVIFPGLLNSLLLKKEYHSNFFINGKQVVDSVRGSDVLSTVQKIKGGTLGDGNELCNAISVLFVATCYKLLATHQNSLFSDKGFTESRLFLVDMVLTYFGVGVTIDGHVVGDETNLFNDIIKLENNTIIIIRPQFVRAKPGLLQSYYEFNKIQTGRFYHYYNNRGEWGKGHQFFETSFWKDIEFKNVLVGDMGQKNLKSFYK